MAGRKVDKLGAGTRAVWGGEDISLVEEEVRSIPVVQPVFHAVSFAYETLDDMSDVALEKKKGHIYSRNTNPTVRVFEEKIRALDGAEASTSFATGMAAISNTLFTLLSPGDRVVSIKESYGGTTKVFNEFLPRFGIEVALCDTEDQEGLEREIEKGCKVLYLESPTNPTLRVLDIARLAAAGKKKGATVIVDNTFATPVNQRPLELGADAVVYSATKYLGGHSDAMGGVLCGSKDLVKRVYHFREINGATLHPMGAYLLLRGLKTLQLRVERQNANALKVARHLEKHPAVEEVMYPGLESHPMHQVAKEQMRGGFGGMLAFSVKGGFEAVKTVLHRLELVHLAASLGAVETLVAPPATSSHVECTAAERAAMGVPESLVRYSAGIEDADDLIADLDQALAAVKGAL